MAAEGIRFSSSYCPAPLCVPSRMSFMTGRYPSRNHVWNNRHVLSSGIPTWAHYLSVAGYETSLIGRMHFVGPDQRHGFEKRPLGEYSAAHPGVPVKGGPRWTRFPSATSGQSRKGLEYAGTGTTHYQWFDDRVTEKTVEYLRQKGVEQKSDSGGTPFAAVSGFVLPHCPFIAPEDLFNKYYEKADIPAAEQNQPESVKRYRRFRGVGEPAVPAERVRIIRAAYYGLCEYVDRSVGKILDALKESGLEENTVVVYTSDHGELAGEHGCFWKSTYYEGSAGIPLIIKGPGVKTPGKTVDDPVNLYDLAPTFAELGDSSFSDYWDGRSILSSLDGNPLSDDGVISEFVDQNGYPAGLPSAMIRRGDWKLWIHQDEDHLPPVLFNLRDDPGEMNDLGEDPGYEAVRKDLIGELLNRWNPETARAGARKMTEAYELLCSWGRKVELESEDALPVPPPELEDDVKLL